MLCLRVYKDQACSFRLFLENKVFYEWIDFCIDNNIHIGQPQLNDNFDKMINYKDYLKIYKHFNPDSNIKI